MKIINGKIRDLAAKHPRTPGERSLVVFELEHAPAKEVFLSGDFNGWAGHDLRMIPSGPNRWEKRLTLPPGRYEYKFIVDGQWTPDPQAFVQIPNAYGSTNSVAVVQ